VKLPIEAAVSKHTSLSPPWSEHVSAAKMIWLQTQSAAHALTCGAQVISAQFQHVARAAPVGVYSSMLGKHESGIIVLPDPDCAPEAAPDPDPEVDSDPELAAVLPDPATLPSVGIPVRAPHERTRNKRARSGVRMPSPRNCAIRGYLTPMNRWPELPIAAWRDTYATLQLYSQIVGKIRNALTPKTNQFWNVPLYVTTRGLTTSPMPYEGRTLSIDFDFIDHRLIVADSDAHVRSLKLVPRSVCAFHDALFAELAAIDVHVRIGEAPQECPVTTRFSEDEEHASYDAGQAHNFWQVLRRIEPVFQTFRARFRGKCSPVHFFWGSFDLAVSRFNGRRAPPRTGPIERDAYDEEVSSLGFWPGDPWTGVTDAAFYAYTIPEPPGLRTQRVHPEAAFFSEDLKEFLLPYKQVQSASDPAREILEFAQSTYDAGSTLAGWDRAALAYP
jgi:hypothetical protein